MFRFFSMERLSIILALLLAACNVQDKNTHEVKIFEDVTFFEDSTIPYPDIFQGDKNELKTAEFSIFNQKIETLRFNYLNAQIDMNPRFFTENGHDIFMTIPVEHQGAQVSTESIHFLSIWKTAPLTNNEFIKALTTSEGLDNTECMVLPKGNNKWQIVPKEIYLKEAEYRGWSGAWPLSSKPSGSDLILAKDIRDCGSWAFLEGHDWNIQISNGFALGYISMFALIIDLNSMTYENKG